MKRTGIAANRRSRSATSDAIAATGDYAPRWLPQRVQDRASELSEHPANPSLPRVLALVRDPRWQDHVAQELASYASVEFVADRDRLVERVDQVQPEIALCHLDTSTDFGSVGPLVPLLHRGSPEIAVLVYCRLVPEVALLWSEVARPAVCAVVFRDHANLAREVRQIYESRWLRSALREVITVVQPLTSPAQEIWTHCVMRSRETVLSVERLAAELGVSRRTLVNRLRSDRIGGPEALIGWSRVLVAVRLLRHPDASFEAIARQMRFSSSRDCRDMIARYTGASVRALRRGDGLQLAAMPLIARRMPL